MTLETIVFFNKFATEEVSLGILLLIIILVFYCKRIKFILFLFWDLHYDLIYAILHNFQWFIKHLLITYYMFEI